MLYLVFLGGVAVGIIGMHGIFNLTAEHGHFTVMPYSDAETGVNEGFYSVRVFLPKDMSLLEKKRIILHKSDSHN